MAQTLLFLREQEVESLDALREKADASCARFNELSTAWKESERRLVEIVELKKHILNYSRTRETCVAYRKAGYSKKYFEAHREALTLHRAAKKAFNELGMARLPRIKDLNAEYARVLSVKKQTYAEYREARAEMRAFAKARRNV